MSVERGVVPSVSTEKLRRKKETAPDTNSIVGHHRLAPYLFSAPAIIVVSVLLAYPVFYGLYMSLFRAQYLGAPEEFVGFRNYLEMFDDPEFWSALSKSAIFVFGCIVLNLALGLVFASALSRVASSLRFLRSVVIAPYIISNVAAAVMFRIVFNADFGLLNRVIEFFGFDGPTWLGDPKLAMLVVIVCQVWTDLPLTILLLLAGLQSIDTSFTDAAVMDGASGWRLTRYVSVPLIAPQIAISTIWMSYSTLTGLGVVLALTGGGPLRATQTLPMKMYDTAFTQLDLHQALAIATFILVLNAVLTIGYATASRRFGEGS